VSELDLSSVRVIFNGAEPISLSLCDEFMDRMPRRAWPATRCFSVRLAEASVAVSFPPWGSPIMPRTSIPSLGSGQRLLIVPPGGRDALALVAVAVRCRSASCGSRPTMISRWR